MTISRIHGVWKIQVGRLVVRCRDYAQATAILKDRTPVQTANEALNRILL